MSLLLYIYVYIFIGHLLFQLDICLQPAKIHAFSAFPWVSHHANPSLIPALLPRGYPSKSILSYPRSLCSVGIPSSILSHTHAPLCSVGISSSICLSYPFPLPVGITSSIPLSYLPPSAPWVSHRQSLSHTRAPSAPWVSQKESRLHTRLRPLAPCDISS